MKGHINISVNEGKLEQKGKDVAILTDCDMEVCGLEDKLILVHELCNALNFRKIDFEILSVAALSNIWPDTDCKREEYRVDRGAIRQAQEGKV